MPRFATAGARIYIGGALDFKNVPFIAADFTSQTWVEIGGHTNIGTLGDTANEVNSQEIALSRDISVKGTRNAGTLSLTCNIDTADLGQIALIAAEKTINNYAFKIEYPDKPATGASPKGSQRLFIGLVMGVPENLGGANQFAAVDITIKVNSNVVQVGTERELTMRTPEPSKPAVDEKAADPRKVELHDAAGQPIGVTVTLKDAVVDAEEPGPEETKEVARLRALAKSISGWSTLVLMDEPYPFSQERALALFQRFPHFADQVEKGFTKKDAA